MMEGHNFEVWRRPSTIKKKKPYWLARINPVDDVARPDVIRWATGANEGAAFGHAGCASWWKRVV